MIVLHSSTGWVILQLSRFGKPRDLQCSVVQQGAIRVGTQARVTELIVVIDVFCQDAGGEMQPQADHGQQVDLF